MFLQHKDKKKWKWDQYSQVTVYIMLMLNTEHTGEILTFLLKSNFVIKIKLDHGKSCQKLSYKR